MDPESLTVDTSFLIDLQNEKRQRGPVTGATALLTAHRHTIFYLPAVARGEYLEGFDDPESREARELVDAMRSLDVTREVASIYAGVVRQLRGAGSLIGTNDLWIAATALFHGFALVTGNVAHFRRIPDLRLVTYRPGSG